MEQNKFCSEEIGSMAAAVAYSCQDPLQHRLHCQVSDCVQCRCDSGYLPSSYTKYQRHRRDRYSFQSKNNNNDDIGNCFRSDSDEDDEVQHCNCETPVGSRILRGGDTISPCPLVAAPYHCYENCQYCKMCVRSRLRSSKPSSLSDHVTVSSSHVCSCTYQPANLQPTLTSTSSIITTSATTTTSTTTNPTRRPCSCPRWKLSVMTALHRFMSRFSGRLRRPHRRRLLRSSSIYGWEKMTSFLYFIITVATFCFSFLPTSDACSSRSTPKPRPPSPTLRPNITIQTYTCPPEYDAHYCLNGATCFTVKIGESILYNCECAEGYMGQRCEFKDLDGSYLPSKQRAMLEQAGLTSGAAIIVVIVVIVCFYLYVRSRRKFEISSQRLSRDVPDGMESYEFENERRPFSGYYYPSPLSLSHNHNHPDQHSFHSPASNTPTSTPTSPTYQQTTTHLKHQKQHHHHQLPVSVKDSVHGSQPQQEGAAVPLTPTVISPVYPKHVDPPPDSTTTH